MEGRVDHARLHPLGDGGAQHRLAGAAGDADPVAVLDAALSASCGWISSRSSSCQRLFSVRRVCAPTLYWLRMRPVVRISGKRASTFSSSARTASAEAPLAAHEAADVHDRRARLVGVVVAGPLHAAQALDLLEAHAREGGRERGDLVHDLRRVGVVHRVAQRVRERLRHLPVRQPASGGITWRTRLMRRSALVKVPSFSRNGRPAGRHGRTSPSRSGRGPARRRIPSPASAAATCAVFGSDCAGLRPGRRGLERCRRPPRPACWDAQARLRVQRHAPGGSNWRAPWSSLTWR